MWCFLRRPQTETPCCAFVHGSGVSRSNAHLISDSVPDLRVTRIYVNTPSEHSHRIPHTLATGRHHTHPAEGEAEARLRECSVTRFTALPDCRVGGRRAATSLQLLCWHSVASGLCPTAFQTGSPERRVLASKGNISGRRNDPIQSRICLLGSAPGVGCGAFTGVPEPWGSMCSPVSRGLTRSSSRKCLTNDLDGLMSLVCPEGPAFGLVLPVCRTMTGRGDSVWPALLCQPLCTPNSPRGQPLGVRDIEASGELGYRGPHGVHRSRPPSLEGGLSNLLLAELPVSRSSGEEEGTLTLGSLGNAVSRR